MAQLVSLTDIERMLDDCAKGSEGLVPTTHSYKVKFNGKVSYLPKGKGGAGSSQKRKSKAVAFLSQVRDMVDHLGIDRDCARSYFPDLKFRDAASSATPT